jgi:hypothetical protein
MGSVVAGMVVVTYAVILFCSVRIWLYMRRSFGLIAGNSALTAKTKAMAVQLNVVLAVQALTPLCLEMVPTGALAMAVAVAKYPTLLLSSAVTLFAVWAPLINALSIILIVRPYRRAVIHALRQQWSSSVRVTTVHVSST